PGDQMRQVLNGTAEQRRAAITALDPEKRMAVLAMVPPTSLEGLPDLQAEQVEARKKQQDQRQMEFRRLRPPLSELLNESEVATVLRGRPEDRAVLLASLDPAKLEKVVAAMPPPLLAGEPEMRRMGGMARSPQQVVLDDLREAKVFRAIYSTHQLEEVLTDF